MYVNPNITIGEYMEAGSDAVPTPTGGLTPVTGTGGPPPDDTIVLGGAADGMAPTAGTTTPVDPDAVELSRAEGGVDTTEEAAPFDPAGAMDDVPQHGAVRRGLNKCLGFLNSCFLF